MSRQWRGRKLQWQGSSSLFFGWRSRHKPHHWWCWYSRPSLGCWRCAYSGSRCAAGVPAAHDLTKILLKWWRRLALPWPCGRPFRGRSWRPQPSRRATFACLLSILHFVITAPDFTVTARWRITISCWMWRWCLRQIFAKWSNKMYAQAVSM